VTIIASNENFDAFLNRLRDEFPEGFEEGIRDEGLSTGVTAYAFVAFMRGGDARRCANEIVSRNSRDIN